MVEPRPAAPRHRQAGQATVESAIVLPLMVFVVLGIVQMSMVQHARIMTEYAAFCSARAGIVWNAEPSVMESAAMIALMPTYDELLDESGLLDPGRLLQRIADRALRYQINRRLTRFAGETLSAAAAAAVTEALGDDERQVVEVEVLNPTRSDIQYEGNSQLGQWLEDAEDEAGFEIPGLGGLEDALRYRAYEVDFDDVRSSGARNATRLTVRVQYLYMMRVPFANWVIHHAWLAQRAGQELYGAIWNPQRARPGATGFSADDSELTYEFIRQRLGDRDGGLLRDVAAIGDAGVYMIPLYATYTMRMQSNPYLNSVPDDGAIDRLEDLGDRIAEDAQEDIRDLEDDVRDEALGAVGDALEEAGEAAGRALGGDDEQGGGGR
ncbi:MAG: pilus assembly protein [Deltaproteobacteria bacterium]|nr:pilus assembly protein [Deltaproteobacteria bacterium]